MTAKLEGRFALNVQRSGHSPVPGVHIFLQRLVRHTNGMLSVTPVCSSLAEIEKEIAELKSELEGIQRQARQAFASKAGGAGTAIAS
ncbi:MAG TPA: hypothetical protein VEB59_07045 [Gemmatimonadales bacterium]|nr:hypothetical protein [Gemmatimonadales bacterium]